MRLAAAALAVTLAACGGGDAIADYVAATASITEQMTRDAFAALPPGAAPTREQIVDVVEARRNALQRIRALTPPPEMEPEHLALTTALDVFVAAADEFVATTAGMDPDAFLAALEDSTAIDALADQVSQACTAWEGRAADLGEPVELGC